MSAAPQWPSYASWLGTDARRASTRRRGEGVQRMEGRQGQGAGDSPASRGDGQGAGSCVNSDQHRELRRLPRHRRPSSSDKNTVGSQCGLCRAMPVGVGRDYRSSILANQPMGGISKPCANKISGSRATQLGLLPHRDLTDSFGESKSVLMASLLSKTILDSFGPSIVQNVDPRPWMAKIQILGGGHRLIYRLMKNLFF